MMQKLNASELVFLDESGSHLAMDREYGRCLSHQRLVCSRPYPRGHKYSIISAISNREVTAALYLECSVNGEIFLHYLEHYLAPTLSPGQQVLMDNVSFHKIRGVKDIIESSGATLIYLPPYSPDLSPIELMWSKIKSKLRQSAARCADTFKQAISDAYHSIQPSDLINWYKHCGYSGSIIF